MWRARVAQTIPTDSGESIISNASQLRATIIIMVTVDWASWPANSSEKLLWWNARRAFHSFMRLAGQVP
ncbi:MAG: hypothetical protein V3S68_09790 [Dehalococcoidia bacterium]